MSVASPKLLHPVPESSLTRCPFCGSSDLGFYEHLYSKDFSVICHDCSAEGPKRSAPSEAERLWNRRVRVP
ncbi:MAG: Lar family restriction alleviation protein [Sphingomonadaceae bacterium]|nr:Lar family restriction alleviation protein [Sphingomonadaceae bacterium]